MTTESIVAVLAVLAFAALMVLIIRTDKGRG
jgi:hypothetical protein